MLRHKFPKALHKYQLDLGHGRMEQEIIASRHSLLFQLSFF